MAIDSIIKNMEAFSRRVDQQVKRVNQYVGEQFIVDARSVNTYKDVTANLRNSKGYLLITPDGDSGDLNEDGAKAANDVKGEVNDYGLVMVAGMNYAAAVEAKGFDVISNSVNKARENHKKLIKAALKI